MIEKTDTQAGATGAEIVTGQFVVETLPDLPKMIEEERVREALTVATDVLNDIAATVRKETQANSPDADRGQGRISADVFDLVSE